MMTKRPPNITPRRWQVLECLAAGMTGTQIAERLGLSANTIHRHKYELCKALGLRKGTELVTWYWTHKPKKELEGG